MHISTRTPREPRQTDGRKQRGPEHIHGFTTELTLPWESDCALARHFPRSVENTAHCSQSTERKQRRRYTCEIKEKPFFYSYSHKGGGRLRYPHTGAAPGRIFPAPALCELGSPGWDRRGIAPGSDCGRRAEWHTAKAESLKSKERLSFTFSYREGDCLINLPRKSLVKLYVCHLL